MTADPRQRREAIKRLLGPAAEELSCEQCFALLDQYVELELRGEDADSRIAGMGAHLSGCPACREDHESLRALLQASE